MDLRLGFPIVLQIAICLAVSPIFGFALLKIFKELARALKQENSIRTWWAFTSLTFFLMMIVLFVGMVGK